MDISFSRRRPKEIASIQPQFHPTFLNAENGSVSLNSRIKKPFFIRRHFGELTYSYNSFSLSFAARP